MLFLGYILTERSKNKSKEMKKGRTSDSSPEDELQGLLNKGPVSAVDVPDRCFALVGGKIIFAILLLETEDSFLVGLPSSLVASPTSAGGEGKPAVRIRGRLITNTPAIRLMKTGVVFTLPPEPEHQFYYYRHILDLVDRLPAFFTQERIDIVDSVVSRWEGPTIEEDVNSSHLSRDGREDSDESLDLSPYNSLTRH